MAAKKHQLYIADKQDVNLESLSENESEEFNFVIGEKGSLENAYSDLYNFSKLKGANFAVIEENSLRLKGNLYFPKLDVYSNKGLFKNGIIGTDGTKSRDYFFVKRHEYSLK